MQKDANIVQVSEDCVRLGLRLGAIVLRGIEIGDGGADIRTAIGSAADELRARFAHVQALRRASELLAFARIYEAVGVNPSKHVSGCQRLLELAWKRGDLPRINRLVDIYNFVTLQSMLSLGAHDLAAVELPVVSKPHLPARSCSVK